MGVDRPISRPGQEVVHEPQERSGEEETHRVVSVPPLDHCIDGAGVDGVGLHGADRDRHAVDDVQQRDGDDVSGEEPVSDINVLDSPRRDRADGLLFSGL